MSLWHRETSTGISKLDRGSGKVSQKETFELGLRGKKEIVAHKRMERRQQRIPERMRAGAEPQRSRMMPMLVVAHRGKWGYGRGRGRKPGEVDREQSGGNFSCIPKTMGSF